MLLYGVISGDLGVCVENGVNGKSVGVLVCADMCDIGVWSRMLMCSC